MTEILDEHAALGGTAASALGALEGLREAEVVGLTAEKKVRIGLAVAAKAYPTIGPPYTVLYNKGRVSRSRG